MDGGDDIFKQVGNLQDLINHDDSPPISYKIILLIKLIDYIHVNDLLMEENWACIHELLLEKQLEYFKTQDKYINWNQENMVRVIINLVEVMNMVFFKTTQNNNNSSNTINVPKKNMVNDKWFSYWFIFHW